MSASDKVPVASCPLLTQHICLGTLDLTPPSLLSLVEMEENC